MSCSSHTRERLDPDNPYSIVRSPEEEVVAVRPRAQSTTAQGAIPKRRQGLQVDRNTDKDASFMVGSPDDISTAGASIQARETGASSIQAEPSNQRGRLGTEGSQTAAAGNETYQSTESNDTVRRRRPLLQLEPLRPSQIGYYTDGTMIPKGEGLVVDVDYQSMNYHQPRCQLREAQYEQNRNSMFTESSFRFQFTVYFFCAIIGVGTGVTAFGVLVAIEKMSSLKYITFTEVGIT